ncbi:MAG: hypothetical protein GY791_20110 [Alphaproteobacteria bacterium]|nr:hypothetical protein [Alphaproteobacteria bacterium]
MAPDPTKEFTLEIGGSPALAFTAECEGVLGDGTEISETFDGLVPDSLIFDGAAIRCRIKKKDFRGKLWAEIVEGGRVIASAETLNPLNWVSVRSAGPWGDAAGQEGNLRVLIPKRRSIQPLPPENRRLPPPLSGTIVPPLSGKTVPPFTAR